MNFSVIELRKILNSQPWDRDVALAIEKRIEESQAEAANRDNALVRQGHGHLLPFLFMLVLVFFTACQVPVEAPVAIDTPPASSTTPAPSPTKEGGQAAIAKTPVDSEVTPPVTPTTVSLTYHKLSKTRAPVNGWVNKTVTLTGSCVVYLTQTYCWDDGIKTIDFTSNNFRYGPYIYTYWQYGGDNGPCDGGCVGDHYSQPQAYVANPQSPTQSLVNEVFNLGVSVQVDCTETDAKLDCGDFVINR